MVDNQLYRDTLHASSMA